MNRQRGFVLILGLILLVVLSFLSVSVMQTATLEERMAGNSLDRSKAFKGAEAALYDGWKQEAELPDHTTAYFEGAKGRRTFDDKGYKSRKNPNDPAYIDESAKDYWFSTAARDRWNDPNEYLNPSVTLPDMALQPKYASIRMNQDQGTRDASRSSTSAIKTDRQWYRITSRAVGNNGAEVILQGTGSVVENAAQLFPN